MAHSGHTHEIHITDRVSSNVISARWERRDQLRDSNRVIASEANQSIRSACGGIFVATLLAIVDVH
jgi:hypothetical protein